MTRLDSDKACEAWVRCAPALAGENRLDQLDLHLGQAKIATRVACSHATTSQNFGAGLESEQALFAVSVADPFWTFKEL